jgi:hypothetical protein
MNTIKFEEYIALNPQVWELFEKFTMERISKGFKHYSSQGIMHRIRWETAIVTEGIDRETKVYKIPNGISPYLARHFHKQHPEYKEFFETREITEVVEVTDTSI